MSVVSMTVNGKPIFWPNTEGRTLPIYFRCVTARHATAETA